MAIVIRGMSAGLELGVDCYAWRVGPRFDGIGQVEPGVHLVVAGRGDARSGFFVQVAAAHDVIVATWADETLSRSILSEGSMATLKRSKLNLGPYPSEHKARWKRLAGLVTPSTLRRCGLEEFTWTPIPRPSRDPALATRDHLDASRRVRGVLAAIGPDEFLAELQMSFVVFLGLASYSALKQWQVMVSAASASSDLVTEAPAFFESFVAALEAQLELAPPDFFRDPLAETEDVLRPALANLLASLDAVGLFDFVRRRFGLFSDAKDLQDARDRHLFDGDDRPVIVEEAREETASYPALARHLGDHEDVMMACARLLDEGPEEARADARRYLEDNYGS